MPVRVIGFGAYDHESSAVLLEDGEIRSAVQEERLNRQKHCGGFPYNAIAECLSSNGLEVGDIDAFAYPIENEHKFYIYNHAGNFLKNPIHALANFKTFRNTMRYRVHQYNAFKGELKSMFAFRLKLPMEKIRFFPHHKAHFASAHFTSGFEESVGLCIDQEGDGDSTTGWAYKNGEIKKLFTIPYPDSLGLLYNRVTRYLGFQTHDEYKVMGLAAMGKPRYVEQLYDVIYKTADGYKINLKYFDPVTSYHLTDAFYKVFGPAYPSHDEIDERMADIACSAQQVYEEILEHMALLAKQKAGIDRLVLAGGCALNTKANGKLFETGAFKDIFIPPGAGDGGVALGAAQLQHLALGHKLTSKKLRSDSWGPRFTDAEIEEQLKRSQIPFEKCDNVSEKAAQLLADKKIVGWLNGRMEYGPRALGNRSILADPRSADMKDKVNMAIKFREPFRPFAPVCIASRKDEFFDGPAENPFMTFTVNVKPEKSDVIPAVVHFDGTSRLQTINETDQPAMHALLSAFEKITGVPVLMNTSFNVAGEPIVCTPADAIRTFYTSGLDALFLENYLVVKPAQ